jgi:predicted phosphoribosyltransferase
MTCDPAQEALRFLNKIGARHFLEQDKIVVAIPRGKDVRRAQEAAKRLGFIEEIIFLDNPRVPEEKRAKSSIDTQP